MVDQSSLRLTQMYLATVPLVSYARYASVGSSLDSLQQNPEDSAINWQATVN